MDREKDALTEIAQRHEFEIISLGSNRRHMDLPEYRAAIQGAEAVQEQTAAATQELTDLQEQKTELKREIKSLSGASAALKAAERVRVDFDTIRPEKTLTGAVKGVTVEQIRDLKAGHVLNMLERHLPKQLLHLVDKARDLLPEHQS